MVRLATKEDLKKVNKIRKETFDLHINALPNLFKVTWKEKEEQKFLETIINDDKFLIFVFEEKREIIGYAIIEKKEKLERGSKEPRRWVHLSDLGVTEKKRARGVGSEFLKSIEKELTAQGYAKLELNVWEFNQSAMKFYEKNGFETLRRTMEKSL